jgi:pimeloyl-ACP methyl ester carboxylesterase
LIVRPALSHSARALLVCLLIAACGGGVLPTPTPAATRPKATTAPSPTPPPTPAPVAVLDPSMTAEQLFDDQSPAGSLALVERSQAPRDQSVIRDVSFAGADGGKVLAYLIEPTGSAPAPRAGILFLHWLGDDFSSRDEFVDEAVKLAGDGVLSLLITQQFPWSERPSGIDHDRVAIGLQVRTIRRALTLLAAEVPSAKLAIVGHDYGAMYGILTASVETRLSALACMAPDATWVNWFMTYFHVVGADDRAGYAQAMADIDPVTRIAALEIPVLLQFGTTDVYVSSDASQALTEAAPGGTDIHTYNSGHRLDDRAGADRDAWLLEQLGLSPGS